MDLFAAPVRPVALIGAERQKVTAFQWALLTGAVMMLADEASTSGKMESWTAIALKAGRRSGYPAG
jgi:hypothetical protein